MARIQNTFWQRNKFKLSGLLLIFPIYFLYQQLNVSFPDAWQTQQVGPFAVTPMPLDMKQPYSHHEDYVKDFMLMFEPGQITQIRQGYLNIGPQPLPLAQLQQDDVGILHGSRHSQHVHGIAPALTLSADDKVWLTLQDWQGEVHVASWSLPDALIPAS